MPSERVGWRQVPALLQALLVSSLATQRLLKVLLTGGSDVISYVNDQDEFVKEAERELYFQKTGRRLDPGAPIPATGAA